MHTEPASRDAGVSRPIFATSANQKPLCEARLWPGVRTRIFLGEYDDTELKGFLVELTQEPDPAGSLTIQIIKFPSGSKWKVFLQAANSSQMVIKAKVWLL